MLNINKSEANGKTTLALVGRLDTVTAPVLEQTVRDALPATDELVLDLSSLEYISSAGLRVLLSAQKAMNKKGGMVVKGVNDAVMEIFDVTGFVDILTIE